jgi:C4-type Zn-finger protein
MFCPTCGTEMERKLLVEVPHSSSIETQVRYECKECGAKWDYVIDSKDVIPTFKKVY